MTRGTYLEVVFFGQRHQDFNYDDYALAKKVKRLSLRYHRLCVSRCNGEIESEKADVETEKIIQHVKKLIDKQVRPFAWEIEFYDLGFGLLFEGDNIPLHLI